MSVDSLKNTYRLVNPYIEGFVNTVVRAKNAFNAGKRIYNNISNYFTNHVESFYISIQNVDTNKLHHFRIKERRGKDGSVNFSFYKSDNNFPSEIERKIISNIDKIEKMRGGSRHSKDDSTTETTTTTEESEYFEYPPQPITRFIYFYLPYYKLKFIGISPLDYGRIFLPTFALVFNPTVEVRFDLYKIN